MNNKLLTCLTAGLSAFLTFGLASCEASKTEIKADVCNANLVVLGTAQDAGKPQIGNSADPAWRDSTLIRTASSIALVNRNTATYSLFDATPDVKYQMHMLEISSEIEGLTLGEIFLTHGHMGHYLGLAQFGREAMGAKSIPVYAMPKMQTFLENNGPWDLLAQLKNIEIKSLSDGAKIKFGDNISVTPFTVPHRGEYTETIGYHIQGVGKSAVYIPDIDSWEQWAEAGTKLTDIIAANDYLLIDGTFYNGDELPGRDMSKIPHPTITHTMEILKSLDIPSRAKIRFIHLNHSNPALDQNTNAYEDIEKAGYKLARAGERICLD
ncbi:MAG: MBL fold metallo-hydrolase [Robiginitomaculum sp.]|nr:MBL fold metallo-hydrolase [Robiginitomaculum sp.]